MDCEAPDGKTTRVFVPDGTFTHRRLLAAFIVKPGSMRGLLQDSTETSTFDITAGLRLKTRATELLNELKQNGTEINLTPFIQEALEAALTADATFQLQEVTTEMVPEPPPPAAAAPPSPPRESAGTTLQISQHIRRTS